MKHYGWGIVDKDGNYESMRADLMEGTCQAIADYRNGELIDGHPFRAVQLFYKEAENESR